MGNGTYKELVVWQRSMEVAKEVYLLIKKLPKEETYAIGNQMRRAAVSIPSNIAEGQERDSKKEFTHFLSIVGGSKAELETQLELCVEVGFLTKQDIEQPLLHLAEIGRMIFMLKKSLNAGRGQ